MNFDRRNFLIVGSTLAGFSLLAACSPVAGDKDGDKQPQPQPDTGPKAEPAKALAKRGVMIGGGGRKVGGEMQFHVALLNLDHYDEYVSKKREPDTIPIDFRGHAVVTHPNETHKAVVFEKWGLGACEIDLRAKTVLRKIEPTPRLQFYGHGAFSLDGTLLYAVESEDRTTGAVYDGYVVVRDAKTMKVLRTFPSYGKSPHDCHLIDQGKTLLITNGGGRIGEEDGCVTFVDIATEKLIERLTVPGGDLSAGHLAISARWRNGDLAVVSTPREREGKTADDLRKLPGAISLRAGGKSGLTTMAAPADVTGKMLGETLSVAILESKNIVGATNPDGDIVTFWDIKEGKHLASHNLPKARGIALTLDHKHFVVTYGLRAEAVMIKADDLSLVPNSVIEPSLVSASHFIVHDLPA